MYSVNGIAFNEAKIFGLCRNVDVDLSIIRPDPKISSLQESRVKTRASQLIHHVHCSTYRVTLVNFIHFPALMSNNISKLHRHLTKFLCTEPLKETSSFAIRMEQAPSRKLLLEIKLLSGMTQHAYQLPCLDPSRFVPTIQSTAFIYSESETES